MHRGALWPVVVQAIGGRAIVCGVVAPVVTIHNRLNDATA